MIIISTMHANGGILSLLFACGVSTSLGGTKISDVTMHDMTLTDIDVDGPNLTHWTKTIECPNRHK